MTNVKSLLALYVKMGGSLTDTYSDIAGGIPVGQYSLISDAVLACSKKYSSGGGGLPADFPAEGIANANKFLGFDNSGDYAALDAPSGAEKFVVTITDNSGVTSNKTVAEILAAKAAGKEVVAHVTSSAYLDQVVELPLVWSLDSEQGSAVFFSVCAPMIGQTVTETAYSVYCLAQTGQEEEWGSDFVELGEGVPSYSSSNNDQVLGVSSGSLAWVDANAPLIVTLAMDEQTGIVVGNKTYGEIQSARVQGTPVTLVLGEKNASSVVDVMGNETIIVTFVGGGQLATSQGSLTDYFEITGD